MALNLYLMLVSCLKILDKSLEHIQKRKSKKDGESEKLQDYPKKFMG
jgi:hypothetical protein